MLYVFNEGNTEKHEITERYTVTLYSFKSNYMSFVGISSDFIVTEKVESEVTDVDILTFYKRITLKQLGYYEQSRIADLYLREDITTMEQRDFEIDAIKNSCFEIRGLLLNATTREELLNISEWFNKIEADVVSV